MLNLSQQLEADFARAEKKTTVGCLTIKPISTFIAEALARPNPKNLWNSCWYEGEVCCLFADSNVGKSILAVQIAEEIAKEDKVIYFDFELSDKQLQLRYSTESGSLHQFPPNLYRAEIDAHSINGEDFEDYIISSIEEASQAQGTKILIIDNLTYLCIASEKGDSAGNLMLKLMQLKRKYGLSILVLAHTPKRQLTNPITQNDLAGSKKLYNFFDSVFAIGKSAKDSNLRYVKQVKVRYGNYQYDADNVMVYSIEKEASAVRFVFQGYATEQEHLKEPTENDTLQIAENIKVLHSRGKSVREIGAELGISKSKVQRILNK
jgi:KaiC/GvpD/RAD55 family RecA-like ATPase